MSYKSIVVATALFVSTPAFAQNVDAPPGYADLAKLEVPVVEGDITDRPYRVVGHIDKGVRKATIFSKSPSREKVYRELWEKAQKMGADAVIEAEYGESHITAMSWGSREARGTAIKFLTESEIAAMKAREQPAAPETAATAEAKPVAPSGGAAVPTAAGDDKPAAAAPATSTSS